MNNDDGSVVLYTGLGYRILVVMDSILRHGTARVISQR